MTENTEPGNVLMERDGVTAEVCNDASVAIMQAQGWALADDKPKRGRKAADKGDES